MYISCFVIHSYSMYVLLFIYVVIFFKGYLIKLFDSIVISRGIYFGNAKKENIVPPKFFEFISFTYVLQRVIILFYIYNKKN